jgi:hypothetical protein
MKFGIQFEFHKIPEWSEYYLDYQFIKSSMKDFKRKFKKSSHIYKIVNMKRSSRKISIMKDVEFKERLVMENDNTDIQTKEEIMNNVPFESTVTAKKNSTKIFFIDDNTSIESDYQNFLKIYHEELTNVETFYSNKLYELMKDFTNLSKKMHNKKSSVQYNNIDYSSW